MKVLLYAPQATSAMRHIVESMACKLALQAEIVLYRPNTAGEMERRGTIGNPTLVTFKASRIRTLRGFAHYNPVRQYREVLRLRAQRPDLIHVFNGEGYLLPALMLRVMPGVPMVVTLHDPVTHPGDLIGRVTARITRLMVCRRAASIHVFAEFFREYLTEGRVFPGRVYVTRLGSVADVFTRHDTSSITRENAVLLFGRLEYYKGIDVLVEAGFALAARGTPRHIIIAGPGRVPRKLRAKIVAHPEIFELYDRFVPDNEAAVLLKRSSTCVLPYRQATQSCLPAIADAYGQRIIASRSGSFIEEIPRLGGVLVTPGSVEELAQALADDEDVRSAKRPNPEMYAWPAITDSLLNAYRETIERFHRARGKTASRSEANEFTSA